MCLRNIITFAIIPKKVLSMPLLPKGFRSLGVAANEFQKYMEEMLAQERSVSTKRENGAGNLMGSLIRASEEARKSRDKNDLAHLGLRDDQIFGNIFAFNLAGHETTANTLATSLLLLAANPDYQDWLTEETHRVLNGPPVSGNWKYEEAFPQLQRCLAVMYETLRLYGSIVFIPKSTGFHTQNINSGDRTHVLPPITAVNIKVQALHTNPKVWGPDALAWRILSSRRSLGVRAETPRLRGHDSDYEYDLKMEK